MKAIVIGSGIGGLATAIRLAAKGYQTQVFEQNDRPGGKLTALKIGDYHFDRGPSLFTQPQLLEKLFEEAGKKLEDYLSYEQLEVLCHFFYEDGTFLRAFAEPDKLYAEIEQKLNVSPKLLQDYLQATQTLHRKIAWIFLEKSLHKWGTWLHKRIIPALLAVKWDYLNSSLHAYNHKKLKEKRLVQFFDRYATYNGSNPYDCPAMLSVIPKFEMIDGAFYPKGGMISISNALYQLALDLGVQFHFGERVEEVLAEGKRVLGVRTAQGIYESAVVVSNMDAYFTYDKLLRQPLKAQHILEQERSSSAVIFYWGIKGSFPQLDLHNIFFAKDYEAEFRAIFKEKRLYEDPTVYLNITSKHDKQHSPEGGENWFILINVPPDTGQNWQQNERLLRQYVIQKLNRILQTDIAPLIEAETSWNPKGIEQDTASYQGSLYGTSSNSRFAAFLRHPNFSRQYDNLYFVGGSVHPGGGIPLCLHSAEIVGELVGERD